MDGRLPPLFEGIRMVRGVGVAPSFMPEGVRPKPFRDDVDVFRPWPSSPTLTGCLQFLPCAMQLIASTSF